MILKKNNNLKENDTLLIAEKIKNTGTISLTKIISNQNTDFEKYLSQERNLIKSIAPGNILKDIYHPRCFEKKDTIKPKNKK